MRNIGWFLGNALLVVALLNAPIGATQTISAYAGPDNTSAYNGEGSAATAYALNPPAGLATDASGNHYIADTANHVNGRRFP